MKQTLYLDATDLREMRALLKAVATPGENEDVSAERARDLISLYRRGIQSPQAIRVLWPAG